MTVYVNPFKGADPCLLMKNELLQKMEQSIEKLIQETELLTEEEFETQIITGVWTAKDILSHVAAWDLVFVEMSTKMVNGEELPGFSDFDQFNAREAAKRKSHTRDDIIKEVRKNRKTYTNFLAGLTAEQLRKSGYDFTVESLAENIMSHDRHHLQQIKSRKG
ncbi:MAG: hypothetical protein AYK19_11580 [Theionarchaea archaeon DG-70-1]|nr:MAG: hypothetical protein AYK19_11580 [Theionarchaea archaeon DG-70-1]